MKKLGTLALTVAVAGAVALPALAAEEAPLLIAANGYATPITLNEEKLDTAGIPAVEGQDLLPLRLVAEADHGSAYWDQESNESWFKLGDGQITVKFADSSIWVGEEQVKTQAQVVDGVTYVPASVLELLEGVTVTTDAEAGITITTPNNDPLVKAAYQVMDEAGMAYGMRADEALLSETYKIPTDAFEQVIAFFPMITNPDTVIMGKLAEGADVEAVKTAVEAYRKQQEDTFSWYLSQNLPKVQDARVVVEGDYFLFLIAENADAGEAAFHAFVEAQA